MLNIANSCRLLVLFAALSLAGCDNDGGGQGPRATASPAPAPPLSGFEFRQDSPDAYVRVDRMGQPATNTALLSPVAGTGVGFGADNSRDSFNRSSPDTDAQFAVPMVNRLRVLHQQLAPALDAFDNPQVTRCSIGMGSQINIDQCIAQAAPVILPDVITLDLSLPDRWPNGRHPDDPVVDVLLALALLDMRVHGTELLANLPLNPRFNDATFNDFSPAEFPFLRPAHPGP